VATEAEARKRSKYSSLAATYYFVPVAVETLAALGEEAAEFIIDLSRRITATTGQPRSVAFPFERLTVAIQRGNAASVTGTSLPSSMIFFLFGVLVVLFCTVHGDFGRTSHFRFFFCCILNRVSHSVRSAIFHI